MTGKKLIAGNWKMNGDLARASQLAAALSQALNEAPDLASRADMLVCPPFVHIPAILDKLGADHAIAVGAQDSAESQQGAYTGDIAPQMLRDLGCSFVILGHSERRHHRGETRALVRQKIEAVQQAGLIAIVCIGEDAEIRDGGAAQDFVGQQLCESLPAQCDTDRLVVAYEPVWAIGTGRSAAPADIEEMHTFIRKTLKENLANADTIRILYGGSVKADNAPDILHIQDVDGVLVGGASLKSDAFIGIAQAAATY